jgi:hypothetical protein
MSTICDPFLYKELPLGVLYYAKIPESHGNKIIKIKLEKVTNKLVMFRTPIDLYNQTYVLEKADIKIIEAI